MVFIYGFYRFVILLLLLLLLYPTSISVTVNAVGED